MDGERGRSQTSHHSEINQDDDFKIKGAASRRSQAPHERKEEHADACSICLEPITERAVAVPCNHLTFDFLCLVFWLQERTTCPLCNASVSEVQYDWRSPDDFKTYHVPRPETSLKAESSYEQSRRRRGQNFVQRRARQWRSPAASSSGEDPALDQRRRVYREKLFSLHVGANRVSQHRDFTANDFASSAELQSRARMFLRRELKVFSFLDSGTARNREFILEYIVAILKSNELKGANGHAEDALSDYLGRENARLLLHELEAWLRSPYTSLDAWDRHVQYSEPSPATHGKQSTR
jgi:hypothetical protein